MLSRQFVHSAQLHIITRCFTRNSVIREINKADKIPAQKSSETVKEKVVAHMHHVSNFDKKVLVWVKRYPSIADVPNDVTIDCILTARSRARIKVCNYMIVATLFGCLVAIVLGKRDAARGETLFKQREEWLQAQKRLAQDKNK